MTLDTPTNRSSVRGGRSPALWLLPGVASWMVIGAGWAAARSATPLQTTGVFGRTYDVVLLATLVLSLLLSGHMLAFRREVSLARRAAIAAFNLSAAMYILWFALFGFGQAMEGY